MVALTHLFGNRAQADSKNTHLLALEGAEERLTLCRADVLKYDRQRAASNDPDLVPVAVEGTRNVISAAADAGVRRVVFTSSYGAVHMDPNRSPDEASCPRHANQLLLRRLDFVVVVGIVSRRHGGELVTAEHGGRSKCGC
ncbi:hypothetical protein ACQ4PT_034599 [Festuca glaucescens]